MSCTESALELNARVFESYGKAVATKVGSFICVLLGLSVMAAMIIGVKDLEYENDLDDLWIEEGSRAEEDKRFLDQAFGGGARIGQYAIEPRTGSNIVTPEALYALSNLTRDLYIKTNANSFVSRTFTRDNGTTVNLEFDMQDFCERPEIPPAWRPYSVLGSFAHNDPNYIGQWISTRGDSGLWHFYTNCHAERARTALLSTTDINTLSFADRIQLQMYFDTNDAGLTAHLALSNTDKNNLIDNGNIPGLADGFGIDRAACTRGTMLDCWSDGEYDYPPQLVELSKYGYIYSALAGSSLYTTLIALGHLTDAERWHSECTAEISGILAGAPFSLSALQIGQLIGNYQGGAEAVLQGAGFWWRPSIEDQRSTFQASAFQAMDNAETVDRTVCVAEGVLRKASKIDTPGVTVPGVGVTPNFYVVGEATSPINGGCCIAWPGTLVAQGIYAGTKNVATQTMAATRISTSGMNADSLIFAQRLRDERFTAEGITFTDAELLKVQKELTEEWEIKQINYLEQRHRRVAGTGFADGETFADIQVQFVLDHSLVQLLEDAAEVDKTLLAVGYLVLVIYACSNFVVWSCSKHTLIYSRVGLCLFGMFCIGLSTAASFGILSWAGVRLSPLNSALVPFLSMGLGIDDLFVLMTEFVRQHALQDEPQRRVAETLRDAGSSVTVTSAANVVAFLIACIIRLPAVYIFAYQMAAAVFFNWLVLLLVFCPAMYLSAIRTSTKNGCCQETESPESEFASQSRFYVNLVDTFLAPLYANKIFKIVALVVFFGLTIGLGVVGFLETEEGLRLSDVALKGSSINAYVLLQETHFGTYPMTTVTREVDFTNANGEAIDFSKFQQNIDVFLSDMEGSQYVERQFSPRDGYFYNSFLRFHQAVSANTSLTEIDPALFYSRLRLYFTGLGVLDSVNLRCKDQRTGQLVGCSQVDGVNITIFATKGSAYVNNILTDDDFTGAILSVRADADASGGNKNGCCVFGSGSNGTAFDPALLFFNGILFDYWQQYVGIDTTMYKTVGFALLGVFVATFLFQFSPLSSLLVGIMLLATVLQLYGMMNFIGVKLNGFSVTNLAISVGMAVEFTAHITYAFLRANQNHESRDDRVKAALQEMLQPMLSGALTTFISVVCLAFAEYPFFSQYYFQMIALMILFAFLNGMVFLPVILSLIGPAGLKYKPAVEAQAIKSLDDDKIKSADDDKMDNAAL